MAGEKTTTPGTPGVTEDALALQAESQRVASIQRIHARLHELNVQVNTRLGRHTGSRVNPCHFTKEELAEREALKAEAAKLEAEQGRAKALRQKLLWESHQEQERIREAAKVQAEKERAERRYKRHAQARRRLERWVAQPTPTTTAELRAKLEDFLRIPLPELRQRQARIKARLAVQPPAPAVPRPDLTAEDRLLRRAEKSGDKAKALEIARRYHRWVNPLYRSKHGEVRYGKGGQRNVEWWHRYRSGGKNFPTVWKDAGVWIDYSSQPPTVVIEDYLGKVVARFQLFLKSVTFDGLKDGDLWGVMKGSRVERWAMGPFYPGVVGYGDPGGVQP